MARIDISHLTFAHEGELHPLFDDLSLYLDTGWKLGLIGRNGRGKTTLGLPAPAAPAGPGVRSLGAWPGV